MFLQFIAVLSYAIFVFLNTISIIPRVAGSQIDNNALGYSFTQMLNTIKRIFIVTYPPLLGWITLQKGIDTLIITVVFSFVSSLFFILLAYGMRFVLINYFVALIKRYSEGYSLLKSITYPFSEKSKMVSYDFLHQNTKSNDLINWKIFYTSSWVFLANGSALFIINILGAVYAEKAAIIYQLVGVVSALGTIVMAFCLDPMLSRIFESNKEHLLVYRSLVFAQFINSALFGPFLVLSIYYFLT